MADPRLAVTETKNDPFKNPIGFVSEPIEPTKNITDQFKALIKSKPNSDTTARDAIANKMSSVATEELCIYSNVKSTNDFSSGHAWLSHKSKSNSHTYGLWPDNHPNIIDNGDKSDIRIDKESGIPHEVSFCKKITKEEGVKLLDILKENKTWRYTNTCASFASETFETVTGVNINPNDMLGFETPRKITESINQYKETMKKKP